MGKFLKIFSKIFEKNFGGRVRKVCTIQTLIIIYVGFCVHWGDYGNNQQKNY